jgi:hypothetical protein
VMLSGPSDKEDLGQFRKELKIMIVVIASIVLKLSAKCEKRD